MLLVIRHWMNKELLLARVSVQLRMTVLPVKASQSALNIYNKTPWIAKPANYTEIGIPVFCDTAVYVLI